MKNKIMDSSFSHYYYVFSAIQYVSRPKYVSNRLTCCTSNNIVSYITVFLSLSHRELSVTCSYRPVNYLDGLSTRKPIAVGKETNLETAIDLV
jgi:hypothetical protein